MKAAAALFVAAAGFCAAAALGALPHAAPPAAPPAIVLLGKGESPSLRARVRPGAVSVRRRVQQTRLSAYGTAARVRSAGR